MIARHGCVEAQYFRTPADKRRGIAQPRKLSIEDWLDYLSVEESTQFQSRNEFGYEVFVHSDTRESYMLLAEGTGVEPARDWPGSFQDYCLTS